MIKKTILQARIKRNKLDIYAGEFYQNFDSDFIKDLQQKGISALIGIKRNDGVYTIIGDEFIYYCSHSGIEGKISHDIFLKTLHKNALNLGKKATYEFVKINEISSIWVLNSDTMNAIWNTLLLLDQSNKI